MKFTTIITPAALAVVLSIGAVPAFAGQRNQNDRAKSRPAVGRAVERQDRNARGYDRARNERFAPRAREERYAARDRDYRYVDRRYEVPRYAYRQPYRPGGVAGLVASLGLRFNVGGLRVGIFAGRPFPYRYGYAVPTYRYHYPVRFARGVRYGGVSFLLSQTDASVYVDGYYLGVASEYCGGRPPLPLVPGVHRLELRSPGYAPLVFDVNVRPGLVIPYEGSMRPLY